MAEDDVELGLMVLLTKSRAWRYEDEYRLIGLERSCVRPGAPAPRLITDNGLLELPDGSLRAVIVGHLADATTLDAVRRVVGEASYSIALKRMVKTPNQYKLVVTDVT
jgi:hypothetical protein